MKELRTQIEIYFSSLFNYLFKLKSAFVFSLILIPFGLSATTIEDLDKVRQNHFENNEPFDTNYVKICLSSPDSTLSNYAKGLLGLYFIENININGELYWLEITSQFRLLKNKNSRAYELLLIDDLFRTCMVLKKYYFFQKLLNSLYDDDLRIIFQTYSLFILEKTGNAFNFIKYQIAYKLTLNSDQLTKLNYLGQNIKERVLFDISAINFFNFDTLEIGKVIKNLSKYENSELSDANSFEVLLFNLSLSNFKGNESLRANNIALIDNRKIRDQKYYSPFIAQYLLENMPLLERIRRYLLHIIPRNYGEFTSQCITVNAYLDERLEFKLNFLEKMSFLESGVSEPNDAALIRRADDSVLLVISQMDSEQLEKCIIVEPDWFLMQFLIIANIDKPENSINTVLNSKYHVTNNSENYRIQAQLDSFYKAGDNYRFIDNTNIYHSLSSLVWYVLKERDSTILSDSSNFGKLDSIYNLFNYLNSIGYFIVGGRTNFKDLLQLQLQKYIQILERILLIRRNYKLYEKLRADDDQYYSLLDYKRFDSTLYVATDRERYLAFKSHATKDELYKFDNAFTSTWLREMSIKDSIIPYFKSLWFRSYIRDIIFDIFSRGNISDSVCANMIVVNDIFVNLKNEGSLNLKLSSKSSKDTYLINEYRNDVFCIDNTLLNTKKYANDNNLNLEIENFFRDTVNIRKRIDTTRSNLIYIITDDLSEIDLKNETFEEITNRHKLTIYGLYSFDKVRLVKKIISLDSLKNIFDYDISKSEKFYSGSYFGKLENKSDILYKIFLQPFEKYLTRDSAVNLIMPASLNSIPLDYIYSQKNGKLPDFLEYGSLYKAAIKSNYVMFNQSDSVAIFSEMIYNNVYCNLNKSSNIGTRAGIVPLINSKTERLRIKEHVNSIDFVSADASKENFINVVISNKYPIVHVITHGTYIPNENTQNIGKYENKLLVKNSYEIKNNEERQLLLFSSDSTQTEFNRNKNNLLTSYETRYFEDLSGIKLIYLSACETGSIDVNEYSNSGYQGFVNNLLERGVRSVIATRWKVSDSYSVDFADIYYKNLIKYVDFQKAFYETKKYFFESNTPPYLWTSYVFIQ